MTKTKLAGRIDKLEEASAVIKLADGQMLRWPLAALPEGLAEGESISLELSRANQPTAGNDRLAKDILKEILSTND